jgi:hypothetical protein
MSLGVGHLDFCRFSNRSGGTVTNCNMGWKVWYRSDGIDHVALLPISKTRRQAYCPHVGADNSVFLRPSR